jgi:hypothetical protein
MAIVKRTNVEIGAGVNLDGSRKITSYPVETHDCSGLPNDHVFSGAIPGVAAGNPPQAQPSSPPETVDYAQANFRPTGMNTPPNPPRGKGE